MSKKQLSTNKKNQNHQVKKTNQGYTTKLVLGLLVLLSILIFILPFFRGLFFRKEMLLTHIASFLIFILYGMYKIKQKEKIKLDSTFGLIGLSFIVIYILPVIFGRRANLGSAIDMIIRQVNLFVIYLMVNDFSKEERYKKVILNVLIASGVVTAFIGILGATGYVHLPDVVLGNRIASTFQYPNTLAAFIMTLFFITLGLKSDTQKLWLRGIYAASGFIMLFTFIFTYSRAAWLLFPIFALIYLLVVPGKERLSTLFYYIAVGIPIVLTLQPFTKYLAVDTEKKAKALILVVVATVLFSILYTFLEYIGNKIGEKQYKFIYGAIGMIAILGIGIGIFAFHATEPLVFNNLDQTENKTNQIHRVVKGIESNQSYYLNVDVEAIANTEENQWPWQVRIFGINEKGEQNLLTEKRGTAEEKGEIQIPFTTGEDTQKLNITFRNYYPQTKVIFHQAEIYDEMKNKVSKVKLRYKYIPETFIARLNAIDVTSRSASTRLNYYKDAFTMFKARPMMGGGGGAWVHLYRMYQSAPYNSTEAHNYFLQTLVETGALGLLLLIGLMVVTVLVGYQSIRKKDTLQIAIIIGILSLLGHSFLDFNFSYLSIPILLWVLIGAVDVGFQKGSSLLSSVRLQFSSIILIIMVIPCFGMSTSFYLAIQDANKAVEAFEYQDVQQQVQLLMKAIKKDPYQVDQRIQLANALKTLGAELEDHSFTLQGYEHMKKAFKYAPYDYQVLQQLASYEIYIGNIEQGLAYIEESIQRAPFRQDVYDVKAQGYTAIADYYESIGQKEEAIQMQEKVLSVVQDIRKANDRTDKKIALAEETMDLVQRTKYYLEYMDDEEALAKLEDVVYWRDLELEAATGASKGNWRKWNADGGRIDDQLIEEGLEIWNDGEDYGVVNTPNFILEPKTEYELIIELKGCDISTDIFISVTSPNEVGTQFKEKVILKKNDTTTFTFGFISTEDIDPKGKCIMFKLRSQSDGSFIIKSLLIREKN